MSELDKRLLGEYRPRRPAPTGEDVMSDRCTEDRHLRRPDGTCDTCEAVAALLVDPDSDPIDVDWEALAKAAFDSMFGPIPARTPRGDIGNYPGSTLYPDKAARAVIAEYAAQMRALGMVCVQASDVRTATNWYTPILDCGQEDVRDRLCAALTAAAPEMNDDR